MKKQKFFVIEKLSLFLLFFSFFLRIFGYKTYYLDSDSILKKKVINKFLEKINTLEIVINKRDKYVINHDTDFYRNCLRLYKRSFYNKKLFIKFNELFGIKSDFEKKLGIVIQSQLQNLHSNFTPFAILLMFVNQNKKNCKFIFSISSSNFKKELIKYYVPQSLIIKSYIRESFHMFKKIFISLIKYIGEKLNFSVKKDIYRNVKNSFLSKAKILYFPHKSIFYGKLFIKNYYYNNEKSSPFHRSNIVHIEYDNYRIQDKKILNYYSKSKIKNITLARLNINTLTKPFFKFVFFLFKKDFFLFISNYTKVYEIFKIYLKFCHFKSELRIFEKAKIALIGYDILFPKELSLALDCRNIKTISNSDRLSSTIDNASSVLADIHFVPSDFFTKIIKNKEYSLVTKCYSVGSIRNSFFYEKNIINEIRSLKKKYRKIILVLGYDTKPKSSKIKLFTDIENNNLFYENITKLASLFKDCLFILRSKNPEWIKNPLHGTIIKKIKKQKNIIIDAKEELYRTYSLGKHSDLLIARATSFVDDMLSIKKNVIIYDEFTNHSNYNKIAYNYLKLPIFCDSFKSLKKKFSYLIKKNMYFNSNQYRNRVSLLYDLKNENKNKSKIQEILSQQI